ncbi:MAG: DUF433 domain-containing protein [Anaerolineae bacterium]
MIPTPAIVDVPLRTDENGVIRIGKTRVTLQTVIVAYRQGAAPERIVEDFDALSLSDVFAVISYYLQHTDEVDAYIHQQKAESERIRREIESTRPHMLTLQNKCGR